MCLSRSTTFVFSMALMLLLAGCSAPATPEPTEEAELEAVTLKLNWLHGAQFLGFYVAQVQGFYAEVGLEVAIEQLDDLSMTEAIPGQVVSGKFDFATGTTDIIRAQSEGAPLTAIAAMYQFSPAAFFARADSGIVTPADLAGRTIVVKNTSWERLLSVLLFREGLMLDDVEVVPGGYDMTPFYEGEVEVWAGFLIDEVVLARMEGLELVTLPLYEYGVEESAVVVSTSQTLLNSNPERAERFLQASIRGWDWAVKKPEAAVDILLALFPDMAAERAFHLASFEASIPLILPPDARLGEINCVVWEAEELLADLENVDDTCTTEIFEAATEQ